MDALGFDYSRLFADISKNANIVAGDAAAMAQALNSAPTTLSLVAKECKAMAMTARQFDLLQGQDSDWGWRPSEFISATDKLGRTISGELSRLADLVGRLARPTTLGTAGDLVIVWNEASLKKHVESLQASRSSLEFLLECVPEHDACSPTSPEVGSTLVSPALVNLGNRLRLSMLATPSSPPSPRRPASAGGPRRRLSRVCSMPDTRLHTMASLEEDPGKAQRRARQFTHLLHLAVEKRNGPAVLELLGQRVDPNSRLPGSGLSPLHRALRLRDEYIATLLAAAGADIEEVDEMGSTALLQGVRNGLSDKFVALMCEMRANVDAVDNLGSSSLHIVAASDREDGCIGLLIDAGANTDAIDVQGLTPLATAVVKQKHYAVGQLVEHGADIEGRVGGGVAAVGGGGGGGGLGSNGRTVLHMAIANRDLELVRLLCELGAYLDRGFGDHTALTYAISIQALDIAELLIESGADVNHQTRSGNFALLAAVSAGSETLTRLLLERSAAVWMAGSSGYYPIHMAAHKNRAHLVRILIKRGSQVDPVTNDGETPLWIAVRLGNTECIDCLVGLGADVNHVSAASASISMLWLALRDGNMPLAKTLISAGADVGAATVDDKGNGTTPLHFACARGLDDVVRAMMDAGANLETQVWPGHSPLFVAARACNFTTVRLLVEQGGANMATESAAGETILFGCTAHVAMIKYLVGRGVRINHRDHHGATALHHAGLHGHHATAKVLLQHGARPLHANAVYDSLDDFRTGSRYRQGTPAGLARQKGHFKVAKLIDGWKYKS